MCLVSLETQSRDMNMNDEATVGYVLNHAGTPQVALVPIHREKKAKCLCAKDGFCLLLAGLTPEFLAKHNLDSADQTIVFREIGTIGSRQDRVKFKNGTDILFRDLPQGTHVMRVERPAEEDFRTEDQGISARVTGAEIVDGELVAAGPAMGGGGQGSRRQFRSGMMRRVGNSVQTSIGVGIIAAFTMFFLK